MRRRKVWMFFIIVFLVALVGIAMMFILSLTASTPTNLGVYQGRLAKCPGSPNCVSTQAEDREHWIAPMTIGRRLDSPIDILEDIVLGLPRTRVIDKTNEYLRVEFRTAIFQFVDDVEFYFDADSGLIHFRSASRVGYSDLGVNRTRMERIRRIFEAMQSDANYARPSLAL